jgi:hypothetical protein
MLFRIGMRVTFDISLPLTAMEEQVAEVLSRLECGWPDNQRFVFGQLGGGDPHIIAAGGRARHQSRERAARVTAPGPGVNRARAQP